MIDAFVNGWDFSWYIAGRVVLGWVLAFVYASPLIAFGLLMRFLGDR